MNAILELHLEFDIDGECPDDSFLKNTLIGGVLETMSSVFDDHEDYAVWLKSGQVAKVTLRKEKAK